MNMNGHSVLPKSSFDGVWVGVIPETEKLKRFDSLKNQLRELGERFENRLVLERCSWCEAYVDGRLSVVVYLDLSEPLREVQNCPLLNAEANLAEPIAALVFDVHPGKATDIHGRDEESMLVDIVKCTQFPDLKLTSLVRLYFINDMRGKIGQGFLYRSVIGGALNVVPFFAGRHGRPIVTGSELNNDVVEGRSKVMNCITNNERDFGWKRGGRVYLDAIVPRLRILLNMQSAEVSFEEGYNNRQKILDVAVGPLNL
jgi:hypothetical protein